MRAAKVPPNSASLDEAKNRVFDLFRTACRSLPSVMEIYNLDDVVTISQLRSAISSEIRRNSHVTNPKVIDMLVFKGMEELGNITEHAKQRHHIIGQYVVGTWWSEISLILFRQFNSVFVVNVPRVTLHYYSPALWAIRPRLQAADRSVVVEQKRSKVWKESSARSCGGHGNKFKETMLDISMEGDDIMI
ncbi:hypothetical protein MLD38_008839 [Melastoma candidum]|nr:hypothetical protein MLD38_008839 [Melastoma candidum]